MASEDATHSATHHDQAPSVYESMLGEQADNLNTSGNRQLNREGDPFSTNSGSQDQQDTLPIQHVQVVAPPAVIYVPQSPTEIISPRDADNLWIHDGIPRNRNHEHQAHSNFERPLPSPPAVRLAGEDYVTARLRQPRTISIDPNHRLSNAPQSARLSRNASLRRPTIEDTGEKTYDTNGAAIIRGSIKDRLKKTIDSAESERDKYASRAQATGLALNVAIGLQVLLGSLTTGLSAVATRGRDAAVATTILGALATLVASYLARARGSNEPELSITRTKDLEHFLRECHNFSDDHGAYVGHDHDEELNNFRRRFEELLGNANGERKLSPPGS